LEARFTRILLDSLAAYRRRSYSHTLAPNGRRDVNISRYQASRPQAAWFFLSPGCVMNVITLLVRVVLCGALFATAAQAQQQSNAPVQQNTRVEQTLRELERAWATADMHKDPGPLQSIIAEDWFNTGSDGRAQSKKDLLADVRSNTDLIQSEENYDVTVRVFGKTAVLIGGTRERGTRQGKPYDERYRWTDVWIERDGRWQTIVSQSVKVL
jgi:hypothetical protein